MSRADQEFERAREALKAAGFSNSAISEMLMKRAELRDKVAMAALPWVLDADEALEDRCNYAYEVADAMLKARSTVRDSERPT